MGSSTGAAHGHLRLQIPLSGPTLLGFPSPAPQAKAPALKKFSASPEGTENQFCPEDTHTEMSFSQTFTALIQISIFVFLTEKEI